MLDIACVGIAVADVVVRQVDRLPEPGKLSLFDSISLYSGGCAVNAAVDLARLGAECAMVGMVGNDGFGSFLRSELTANGVDIRGLAVRDDCPTSASVVLINENGERSFLHSPGANGYFRECDVDYSVIDDAKIVFVAGCMLMPGFDGQDCAKVLKYAREHGKITVLDTAWDDTGRWMNTLYPCMRYLDYFIPSIDEARRLSGREAPEDIADVFFGMGVKHVAVKLGGDGCFLRAGQGSENVYLPTYKKFRAVDTTGAGDSFCAGFLYGLSRGFDMADCCRLGNAVGTHCVMSVGASTGIRSYAQTAQFMKENKAE